MKKILCMLMAFVMSVTLAGAVCSTKVNAAESRQNSIILSNSTVTVTQTVIGTFTAALPVGFDASNLTCVVADSNVATASPIAYVGNVAAFAITYANGGSTVAAVVDMSNPALVAYLTVNASGITMEIPSKLGTNHDNYCTFVSYEFVPYDFTYTDYNDYHYTLNIKYKCSSYEDGGYTKWGCYGYFYDAAGNVITKVHLYASSLSKGRVYHSEFNVPVNAVRFSIEGF
jgi:hypothetical protein